MPMRYANEDDVLALLDLDSGSDEYDALVRLENGLADMFDHKVGTAFGTAPVAELRSVAVLHGGGGWFYPEYYGLPIWSTSPASYRLIIDTPIRSVTGIVTGGTWNGTTWDDGTTLTADEYRLTNHTNQGYYAIDLTAGTWSGVVRITGIWADQVALDVPDDVRQAMTFLTVNEWHTDHASPAGYIGPDGIMVSPRNPWAFEKVKAAIDRHTVVGLLV
jgi:hypothetical protein